MQRVFVADPLDAEGVDRLRLAGLEVDHRPGLAGNELTQAIRHADGLIVRSQTQVTAELLEESGQLKAIARAGVGVDNIDLLAATRKGIVVMNAPGGNTLSTCEHTLALLFALARHIPSAVTSLKQGAWKRNQFTGTQLAGKTLGILGLGRIGREVAKRALAMQMRVIGYDPMLPPDRVRQWGIEPAAEIAQVLPACDILTIHIPLTEKTQGIIGRKELALMKPGSWVINCARGGIIDETALVEALDQGHLGGAALDVFEKEPLPHDHPLLKMPNVICTPHLGASTREAQRSVALEAAECMIQFLQHGRIQGAVNMNTLDRSELLRMRYELDLAYRLGLLMADILDAPLKRIQLSCTGEAAEHHPQLLTSSLLVGLLSKRLTEPVNLVNAALLAKERGFLVESKQSTAKSDFRTLLRVEAETEKQKHSFAGTLFGKNYVRLVQWDAFQFDAYLDGQLLLMNHQDMPGLIGFIGSVLGKHQVNIAQMTVGRQQAGGEAIAVLNLDSLPPKEALSDIQVHPHVHSLRNVSLPAQGELPPWLT